MSKISDVFRGAVVGIGVVLLGIYYEPAYKLINSVVAPYGISPVYMVFLAIGLIVVGTIPSVVIWLQKWTSGQLSTEEEKPERIVQHYHDISEKVFKKWTQEKTGKSRYCIIGSLAAGIPLREAPLPIFYRVPQSEVELEWTVRALRHLAARRYRKLAKVVRKIQEVQDAHNKMALQWFDKIQGDVASLTLKYPLGSQNENYQSSVMVASIIDRAHPMIHGSNIMVVIGGDHNTLASINDTTIRTLVMGEMRLLIQKYNARAISSAEWDIPKLLEIRNDYLNRIIHEIEANHLLEGKCDFEDPSQPIHQSTPKW